MNICGNRSPQVGDEIVHAFDSSRDVRRYLAIRIGPDISRPGSDLWFAWRSDGGTLATVSVGYWWILKTEFDMRQNPLRNRKPKASSRDWKRLSLTWGIGVAIAGAFLIVTGGGCNEMASYLKQHGL